MPGSYSPVTATLRPTPDDERDLGLLGGADRVSEQAATVRAIHEAASRGLRQDTISTLPRPKSGTPTCRPPGQ